MDSDGFTSNNSESAARIGKKASNAIAMTLIFLLIVTLLLLATLPLYVQFFNYYGDVEGCRDSFMIAGMVKSPIVDKTFFEVQCPRRNMTFGKKDAFTGTEYDAEKLKKKIADEFRTCWYMTDEGYPAFGNNALVGTTRNCIICTEMKFDDNLISALQKQGKSTKVEGLYDYFKNTQMGQGKGGSPDWTYSKYILTKTSQNAWSDFFYAGAVFSGFPETWGTYSPTEQVFKDKNTVYDIADKDFVLMYLYYRTGATTKDYYTVDLVPATKINDMQCEKLWN